MQTGARIEAFEGGWAVLLANNTSGKAHYWQQPDPVAGGDLSGTFWKALCGVNGLSTAKAPAVAGGSFPQCKRCVRGLV